MLAGLLLNLPAKTKNSVGGGGGGLTNPNRKGQTVAGPVIHDEDDDVLIRFIKAFLKEQK